ncbi:type II secretion system F family protein [Janthinobacterium aestuarii]
MQFELKTFRQGQGISSLVVRASSLSDARQQAEILGHQVISVRRQMRWNFSRRAAQSFSVPLFSQELLSLLEAGLSLIEIIDLLERKSRHESAKKVLRTLFAALHQGYSFSRALEELPEVFSPLYVATIRTSEQTGDLIESLRRYLTYHQQLNIVRDKIVAASVYPALLITVGALVVLFLLGYVVPRFSRVYEDLGRDLPWMSQLLMHWGKFVGDYGLWLGAGVLLALLALVAAFVRPGTRAAIERRLWNIPAVGEKMRLYQLARFTRTLAMLVNGGIPFVTALEMVNGLLHQPGLRHGLAQAGQLIREGRSVSDAFSMHGLASEVGVRLLAVGERSGNLGRAMERVSGLYEDELARWIDWFGRLFEPLLMIGIGLIIGLIVILMYMPIFELASSIQ